MQLEVYGLAKQPTVLLAGHTLAVNQVPSRRAWLIEVPDTGKGEQIQLQVPR